MRWISWYLGGASDSILGRMAYHGTMKGRNELAWHPLTFVEYRPLLEPGTIYLRRAHTCAMQEEPLQWNKQSLDSEEKHMFPGLFMVLFFGIHPCRPGNVPSGTVRLLRLLRLRRLRRLRRLLPTHPGRIQHRIQPCWISQPPRKHHTYPLFICSLAHRSSSPAPPSGPTPNPAPQQVFALHPATTSKLLDGLRDGYVDLSEPELDRQGLSDPRAATDVMHTREGSRRHNSLLTYEDSSRLVVVRGPVHVEEPRELMFEQVYVTEHREVHTSKFCRRKKRTIPTTKKNQIP
ncbi:hypothetical protein K456DRAFT_323295 [Colletotrichum gloeosporioides 23]|nr:hypothetical protein K456DRAFT_323295 [Colletotrichum gloeosporioides 23]